MARPLKVFRTPIGFHDAYVAAASRKEALRLWGSTADLFARGMAEQVADEALTREPLARPGEVVRRPRGTTAEHLAALPPDPPAPAPLKSRAKPARPKPAPPPKPSRDALDRAEQALAEAAASEDEERDALRRREAALAEERRVLMQGQEERRSRLAADAETAREAYEAALARWRAKG